MGKDNFHIDSKFLRAVLLFAFLFFVFSAFTSNPFSDEDVLQIHPDYKLRRMSNGEVVVTKKLGDDTKKSYSFEEIYADLLLAAHRKQNINYAIKIIAQKYYLSEDESRREIKHAINVLSEWGIIILEPDQSRH